MSNHYHIVLKIDAPRARGLSDDEVLHRWTQLFSGPLYVQRYLYPQMREALGEAEVERVQQWAVEYRQRLGDLSWYMPSLYTQLKSHNQVFAQSRSRRRSGAKPGSRATGTQLTRISWPSAVGIVVALTRTCCRTLRSGCP